MAWKVTLTSNKYLNQDLEQDLDKRIKAKRVETPKLQFQKVSMVLNI